MNTLKLGLAQIRPKWLNKIATTQIIINSLAEASRQGIELLTFSETFLSGYPFWVCRTNASVCDDPRQQRAYGQYLEEAVEIDGPEIKAIETAARDYGVSLYLGMNERGSRAGRGTVWCSLAAIDAQKGVLGTHRKLMPTYDERLCWGIGDAYGLKTHPFGNFRVGGLNCWENWMPLTRNALYEDGEDVHISVWPGNPQVVHDFPKMVAHEGRVWAVSVAGILSMSDIPEDFEFYKDLIADGYDVIFQGGSQIVGPQGEIVAEIPSGEEGIVGFEADMQSVRRARLDFDPAGHYARPDIFQLHISKHRTGTAYS